MDGIYVSGRRYMVHGDERKTNLFKIIKGNRYFGFDLLDADDNGIEIRLENGTEHRLENNKWYHFEDLRTTSYEIYGDEYESTVGTVLDVSLGIYATPVCFDKVALGGINKDRSILASKSDEDGNPTSHMAIIFFGENESPRYNRIVKRTKDNFLREYRLWLDGDKKALSFMDEWEYRGTLRGEIEYGAAYILKRMYDYSLEKSVAEIISELYDDGYSEEAVEKRIYEFFDSYKCLVSFYGGKNMLIDAHKEGDGSFGNVYHFEDNLVSIVDGTPDGVEIGVYNRDILRHEKYNMVLTALAHLDDGQLTEIRKNIITRILADEPVDDYLGTLGFPIAVQYDSAHYKRLCPTIARDTGRTARFAIEYTEKGHNSDGDPVDYHFVAELTTRAGYISLSELLSGEKGIDYPRNSEYIKIEEIGEDYVDVRFPLLFEKWNVGAKSNELAPAHRVTIGEPFTMEEHRTVTCHKYSWDITLTVTPLR